MLDPGMNVNDPNSHGSPNAPPSSKPSTRKCLIADDDDDDDSCGMTVGLCSTMISVTDTADANRTLSVAYNPSKSFFAIPLVETTRCLDNAFVDSFGNDPHCPSACIGDVGSSATSGGCP